MEELLKFGEQLDRDPELALRLAEELLWVRGRVGGVVPLQANEVQRKFEQQRGRENVVLKARQMGMTTWVAARFFLRTICRPGTLTLQVAHTREASQGIFAAVRRMWMYLPDDLRKGPLRLARSTVGQLVFAETGSEFRVASAGEENAGRGMSVQNLHCSEVAHWPGDAGATLAGLRAALVPDGECVLESTPNGTGGAFYNEWQQAVEPGVGDGPVRHFFPWWMEKLYTLPAADIGTMTAVERALVEAHGLTAEQIGYRRRLQRSFGMLHSQEYAENAETCFRASGACSFQLDAIEDRLLECPEVEVQRRNGALQIWLRPEHGREYLLAVDTASGHANGDFSAVQVLEVATGMQCAELQERLRPAELAHVVAELAREYNGATVVVERNNHGGSVLAYLENPERCKNVWRDHTYEPGWWTMSTNKPHMIAALGAAITETPGQLKSRRLLAECRTFVTDDRGRMRASGGNHDDLVISMALGLKVREELILSNPSTKASPRMRKAA